MKKTKWRAYNDLAWTEPIIAPPEDYAEDTNHYSTVIKEHSKNEAKTLLHLGCGAGGNDYTFKKHFKVTGVDISKNMLEMAAKLNPEARYIQGDMRAIKLKKCFDAVVIPDSIGHMTTLKDLQKAILTAYNHLRPGGVLLIIALVREEFRENNFFYTGSKGGIEITLFENNHISDPAGTTYESTVIYLIRHKGKLEIHSDTETLGLFKLSVWLGVLKEIGFEVKQMELKHSYDRYLAGKGEYYLRMFICSKSL
jgi:SAM-dependent methyltransferase